MKKIICTIIKLNLLVYGFILLCTLPAQSQKVFPKADIKLMDGSIVKEELLKDKLIVLNLWASWCKVCIGEVPELNKLREEFKNNNEVVFFALAYDNAEKVKQTLTKNDYKFIQLHHSNKEKFKKSMFAFPMTIIYDKNGNRIKRYIGPIEGERIEELKDIIKQEAKAN